MAVNSMVSGGCIISGSVVRGSLLHSDVRIDERSYIDGAVILPHVDIGKNCSIVRAIVDEGCQIPDGMRIGADLDTDRRRFHVTDSGVVLVTADMLRRPQP